MKEFIVNRSFLLTGSALNAFKRAGYSSVLHDTASGMSCVLGQYLLSKGATPKQLDGRATVSGTHMRTLLPPDAQWLLHKDSYGDSLTAEQLTDANDSDTLHQIRRETKINKLFASQDVAVSWTGKYAEGTRRVKRYVK